MLTQTDKQDLLQAIDGSTRAIVEDSKRELLQTMDTNTRAIVEDSKRELLQTMDTNTRAIVEDSKRELLQTTQAIVEETKKELLSALQVNVQSLREDIHDNTEAIALLAEQMEEHRTETRRSFAHVREHVDRRVLDLEVKIGSPTRYTNRQVKRVVEKLHEKHVFNAADVTDVLSMSAFSNET